MASLGEADSGENAETVTITRLVSDDAMWCTQMSGDDRSNDGVTRPVALKKKLKEEDEAMEAVNITERTISPVISPNVVEDLKKMREAMYHICLFHSRDFRKPVGEHDLTHGKVFQTLCI